MQGKDKNFWSMNRYGDAVRELSYREPSVEETQLLLDRLPHLEMIRVIGEGEDLSHPEWLDTGEFGDPLFLPNDFGWIIQYWPGDLTGEIPAIVSASIGHAWPEPVFPDMMDDDMEEHSGRGTIVRQTFFTAAQLVGLAKDQGWQGIRFKGGTDAMKWSAWCFAEAFGVLTEGYEPTPEALARQERVAPLVDEVKQAAIQALMQEKQASVSPGQSPGRTEQGSDDD